MTHRTDVFFFFRILARSEITIDFLILAGIVQSMKTSGANLRGILLLLRLNARSELQLCGTISAIQIDEHTSSCVLSMKNRKIKAYAWGGGIGEGESWSPSGKNKLHRVRS